MGVLSILRPNSIDHNNNYNNNYIVKLSFMFTNIMYSIYVMQKLSKDLSKYLNFKIHLFDKESVPRVLIQTLLGF